VYRAATPDQRRRVHRALAEATDALVDPDRGAWHLAEATVGLDEDVAAELQRVAGRARARGGLAAAAAFLERAAALTPERSRRAQRALAAAQTEYEAGALAGPPPAEPPGPSDLLLHGLAVRFTDGFSAGAPILKDALRAFGRETVLAPEEARWLWFASWIALYLWDDDAWTVLSSRQLDLVRETGALTALPFVLTNRSSVCAFFGDLGAAAAYEEELRAATEATGIATVPYGALALAALRGREAELTELIRTTVSEAEVRGEGLVLTVTEFLSGVLYNGLGRYDEAVVAVGQPERYHEEGPAIWTLTELIEAAVRSGQPQLAADALERIGETTRASGTDWALGVEARCRALLSNGDAAESLYREGIERLGRTSIRVDLARAHLHYGEWLRREQRRRDAREQLRTAFEMFTAIGIEAFAGRAERELLATGERVRKRSVGTRDELTAQETQIARLAREGLSNPDIGERLFISQHTVAYHLRKVFSKLDITSRDQLDGVLPDNAHAALVA